MQEQIEERVIDEYIERLEIALLKIMSKLGPELTKHLEDCITNDQFIVLRILSHRGSCTVTELANEHKVNPAAITAMMDRLSKNGLIYRERDGKDRRTVNIKLSDRGLEVLNSSERKRKQLFKHYFSKLPQLEMEKLVNVSEKFSNIVINEGG